MDKTSRLHRCDICNKEYSSYKSLWNHNNKFHINNKLIHKSDISISSAIDKSNDKPNISQNENKESKYCCKYCNKKYLHFQSRWKHEKKCKNKDIIVANNQTNNQTNNQIIQNNNINNNINNGTINNNQKQIIINQIGREPFDSLPIKDILKIISEGNNMPITCIKKLNFNKNIPENHSFCTTTLEGKHFTRINHLTQKPEKINKIDFINEVLDSSLRFINNISIMTEFDEDYREKIPLEYQNKIRDILDNQHKFCEAKNKKAFFNCINDMSYNFKDIILETWKLIQPVEKDDTDSDGPPLIDENYKYVSSDSEDEN
jgi:hypothetical protein